MIKVTPMKREWHTLSTPGLLATLALAVALLAGCNGTLDSNIATLNAAATNAATTGINVTLPPLLITNTPGPTAPPNLYDLVANPADSVAHAWGQVYGLPRGSEFTILANEAQAGEFVIATLQLSGWQDMVKNGSVAIGVGQIRLETALLITNEEFGAGTVSFQPTLDGMGRIRLNPLGASFGSLDVPGNLISAMGDAVHTLLSGAANDSLSRVTLSQIALENGVMRVSGTVR